MNRSASLIIAGISAIAFGLGLIAKIVHGFGATNPKASPISKPAKSCYNYELDDGTEFISNTELDLNELKLININRLSDKIEKISNSFKNQRNF